MFIRNSISVLLQEAFDLVGDIQCIMSDREGGVAKSGFLEYCFVLRLRKLRVEFREERRVRPRGHTGFFIQESKDSEFSFDNIDTRLVVGEIDKCPVYGLSNVFLLFKFEHVRVELSGRQFSQYIRANMFNDAPLAAASRWHN
jgi:hypothetical protein